VEFAVSLIVLWLIVAATLDLGRAFAASHVIQSAARSATRTLALDDTQAWNASFADALPLVFDADYLVVDADCLAARAATNGHSSEEELSLLLGGHSLNQMLRTLMIVDNVDIDGEQHSLLRYPGALLRTAVAPGTSKPCATGFTVGIPEVDENNSRIVFHSEVEEVEPVGDYSLDDGGTGTVGLRVLYPFQAASLSGWRIVDDVATPVLAEESDGYAVDTSRVSGSLIAALDERAANDELQAYARRRNGAAIPVYGGSLGLGIQGVLSEEVRPYRRVLRAQAFAPREVLGVAP